ncbi:MAG: SLC13 family permease [Pyramidobacter sp.]
MQEKKVPSLGYAVFTAVISFGVIMLPAVLLGARTQPLFLISWLLTIPLCRCLGYSYKELQTGMFQFMAKCLTPMTIVLCVGAMIGLWNAAGTVPMVTKICLSSINPKYFMVMAFLICLVFSLFTGTSFGTCGTAGVALMGVGLSMGLDPLIVATPIISGAFFGDAFSPLSDSTNVAAGSVGVDLFKAIRYQATVTVPSIIIACAVYYVWGARLNSGTADFSSITAVIGGIEKAYHLSYVTLIPLLVVLVMLLMKVASIPSILTGAAAGFLVSWLYQGWSFRQTVQYMWSGFVLKSDSAFISKIFSRGGITSMTGTAFMFIFAFGLFGLLSTAGIIDRVMEPLTKKMKSRFSAMICTVLLGFISNVTSASGNFSFVFVGNLLRPVYEKNRLNKWDLTRSMTVGCLLSGLLVPWNSNPLTVCGFLDVNPVDMVPYMFTTYIAFAVLVFVTATNVDKLFSKMARGEVPAESEE